MKETKGVRDGERKCNTNAAKASSSAHVPHIAHVRHPTAVAWGVVVWGAVLLVFINPL